MNYLKYPTVRECLEVDPEGWKQHLEQFRSWALERFRVALNSDREREAEHQPCVASKRQAHLRAPGLLRL